MDLWQSAARLAADQRVRAGLRLVQFTKSKTYTPAGYLRALRPRVQKENYIMQFMAVLSNRVGRAPTTAERKVPRAEALVGWLLRDVPDVAKPEAQVASQAQFRTGDPPIAFPPRLWCVDSLRG